MKILFIAPNQIHRYNSGHQRFRNEIANHHDVTYVGPGWGEWPKDKAGIVSAPTLVEMSKADILMTYSLKYTTPIVSGLDRVKIPKVHFLDDFVPSVGNYPGYIPQYSKWLRNVPQDLLFCRTERVQRIVQQEKLAPKACMLPFSVDLERFHQPPVYPHERAIDVFAGMSRVEAVYPNRANVLSSIKRFVPKSITSRVFDGEYVAMLQNSKITVNSMNVWKSFNFKMLEGPACGSLLLTDRPEDENGFLPGHTLVSYGNAFDMMRKIKVLLDHPEELQAIATRGQVFVHKHHSNSVRVAEMTEILEEEL